jgi:hypothetical protein
VTHAVATVAALAGIVLAAGSNPWMAIGIGLLVFGAVLVLNDLIERLHRIEQTVTEIRDHADALLVQQAMEQRSPAPPPAPNPDSQG